jgi:hypothetical protein
LVLLFRPAPPPPPLFFEKFHSPSRPGLCSFTGSHFFSLFYSALSLMAVLKRIKEGERLPAPRDCPDAVYTVMRSCWNADPKARAENSLPSFIAPSSLSNEWHD